MTIEIIRLERKAVAAHFQFTSFTNDGDLFFFCRGALSCVPVFKITSVVFEEICFVIKFPIIAS